MGFERNIRLSAISTALLLGASSVVAASREPLIVTELTDPALVPLSGPESSKDQTLDDVTARFSLAIAQAIQSQQRTIEQACRSRAPVEGAAQFDWQANCAYRRH